MNFKKVLIHPDNARSHTARVMLQKINEFEYISIGTLTFDLSLLKELQLMSS